MEDANKLSAFLAVLNTHWEKFTEELDSGHIEELRVSLVNLKKNIEVSEEPEDLNNAAVDFFSDMKNIAGISSIVDSMDGTLRSGSLPFPEKEMKIKIINYCSIIDDKIIKNMKNRN